MKKNMGKNKILIGECQLINVGMMELGNCHLKIVHPRDAGSGLRAATNSCANSSQ